MKLQNNVGKKNICRATTNTQNTSKEATIALRGFFLKVTIKATGVLSSVCFSCQCRIKWPIPCHKNWGQSVLSDQENNNSLAIFHSYIFSFITTKHIFLQKGIEPQMTEYHTRSNGKAIMKTVGEWNLQPSKDH